MVGNMEIRVSLDEWNFRQLVAVRVLECKDLQSATVKIALQDIDDLVRSFSRGELRMTCSIEALALSSS